MKLFSLFFVCGVTASLVFAQSSDLAGLHSSLTTDCKSIRGHAARIVAEASESQFNVDVARAHLGQVARYQEKMEEHLKAARELLTPAQQNTFDTEHKALERVCSTVKDLVETMEKEFSVAKPDRRVIRELAVKMRNEMTRGKDIHDLLKKKLGIP